VGTGFLVDRDGHFVTAAHVANVKQINNVDVDLRVTIRQKSGDGTGVPFDIVELDTDHDLALCQIKGFKVYKPAESPMIKAMKARASQPDQLDVTHSFASMRVTSAPPAVGSFVLLSGFPLGSWTPTIQLGLVSATRTVYPPSSVPIGLGKYTRDMLQISVNGNHGNSGGPIIDLATGDVTGVLLQLIPAPVAIGGQLRYDAGTFEMSGLMLAAPASWVNALLSRNNVHSESIPAGKLVIW
jgi:S1-C subfamily serine protease